MSALTQSGHRPPTTKWNCWAWPAVCANRLSDIVRGWLNKQIGGALGVHEKTIKVHRARVFKKMGVRNVAELVRMTVPISE
jgi:DNA-binding NarL/FixJ family response regulator